jgi:hypothetical protein
MRFAISHEGRNYMWSYTNLRPDRNVVHSSAGRRRLLILASVFAAVLAISTVASAASYDGNDPDGAIAPLVRVETIDTVRDHYRFEIADRENSLSPDRHLATVRPIAEGLTPLQQEYMKHNWNLRSGEPLLESDTSLELRRDAIEFREQNPDTFDRSDISHDDVIYVPKDELGF